MSINSTLLERADYKCELCGSIEDLIALTISPRSGDNDVDNIIACKVCKDQMINVDSVLDENHWRCLTESMWNSEPAVQVAVYRMLSRLEKTDWATELKNTMYMDESTNEWAESEFGGSVVHKDANGNTLKAGDNVVLIQDLKVKGANFTAKRGTAVRRISLVHDNPNHIEGRVEDQHIVILTQYVKKT
jgi:protein PhnA